MLFDSLTVSFLWMNRVKKQEIMADVILVQDVLLGEGLMSTLLQMCFAFSGSCCSK